MKRSQIIKYCLSLLVAVLLFTFLYRGNKMEDMWNHIKEADFKWVIISAFIALISHVNRGVRWGIMLKALGYKTRVQNTVSSVLSGYFMNTLLPRAGEVARCSSLYKTDKVPVEVSFGAVVAERVLDLFLLMSATSIVVLVEYETIAGVLGQGFQNMFDFLGKLPYGVLFLLAGIGIVGLGVLAYFLRKQWAKRKEEGSLMYKVIQLLLGFKAGFLSIKDIKGINRFWFVFHSLSIWSMYYLMTYVLFLSFEETSSITWIAALAVFVMGGIGMVFPSPGGIGSYHLFVIGTLEAYGYADSSKDLAFFLHTSQTFAVLALGGIASLYIMYFAKNKTEESSTESEKNSPVSL